MDEVVTSYQQMGIVGIYEVFLTDRDGFVDEPLSELVLVLRWAPSNRAFLYIHIQTLIAGLARGRIYVPFHYPMRICCGHTNNSLGYTNMQEVPTVPGKYTRQLHLHPQEKLQNLQPDLLARN